MNAKNRGFTLVELNLSVMFVALLILGIAMTTIQVTRMYQKGVTVKAVNQVGRDVVEQMRRDFAAASPRAVVFALDNPSSGRICLGGVSYLYNSAANLTSGSADGIYNEDVTPSHKLTLVRVEDRSGVYCQTDASGEFEVKNLQSGATYTELLEADAVPLAVHRLSAEAYMDSNTGSGLHQALYSIGITLGTNEAGTVDDADVTCEPPTKSQANFDNCFVSEFKTVVRAGEVSQ